MPSNYMTIVVGILQAAAAVEALYKGDWKMGVIFLCYSTCSTILGWVK